MSKRVALTAEERGELVLRLLRKEATASDLAREASISEPALHQWRVRWHLVIPFLAFSQLSRRAVYTTNAIESLNATVRRSVRARSHFTSVGRPRN